MSKSKKTTFFEAYEEYLIYAEHRLKNQTYRVFVYNFEQNVLSYFKDFNIEDITAKDIMKWQKYVLSKNFSNSHNKNLYGMIKKFFDFCEIHYGFNSRILNEIGPFKQRIENKQKKKYYSLKEFKKFIKFLDNNMYKQFFNFLFFTGVRPGEAMALKFSDMNNEYISINKTMDEHGKREVGTPKTMSSNRTIRIDKQLVKDLLNLKCSYQKEYKDTKYDYYIFGGKKPLAPTTINRYKKQACEKSNLESITLHQFRHSHATLLLHNDIEIHEISKRLGHSKVSTTLDVYTHENLNQEKRVCDTLNSMRFNFFKTICTRFKNFISILKP